VDSAPRLKIGIYFNARREQGGLFQYALTLIHCLNRFGEMHDYTFFHATLEDLPVELHASNWKIVALPKHDLMKRYAIELALMNLARAGWRRPLKVLPPHPQFREVAVDLMLYVKPTIHAFLWPFPFVFPIHDLQHRLQSEFPEVSAGGEWSRREYIYRNAVPKAAAILTDSEAGQEDVVKAYKANPAKVHPLPYLAPMHLTAEVSNQDIDRVRTRYQLPERYLFYPASFWPHKNHACLLNALKILQMEYQLEVHLVFAGSCRHECERLKSLASELGLTEKVHFLGYVPDEDVYPLYCLASALVMPTFFGPTNIPVLEAWSCGCPVITSDIRGIREQICDAGLLADPRNPADFARAISELYQNTSLRARIIERGRTKVAQWTPADFATRLEVILLECASTRPVHSTSRMAQDVVEGDPDGPP